MDSTVPSSHMFRISLLVWVIASATASVSYDDRALIINGNRRILISGSIHYPRSTPDMWPDLIQKAKDGGVEVIETYVFWNGHEPFPGNYNFEGRYDLVEFIKAVHKAGLYAMLRIGPYVCAEWNFGGFPVWLKYVPGIAFRTDNQPFKVAMRKFTEKIVNMMNGEKLFEPQGGPIIMSQIENEYGLVESGLGTAGKTYMSWASRMAVGLKTEVPWVMCKQADAPDPVINTWNDFYSDAFVPNSRKKPKFWTENWTGWFTAFGDAVPHRPVEDIAYAVARFIEKGGSFVNYYMYHGGTNFGRTAGGPFIATSYDYDAPIDEYGLLREPKWGHLRHLHEAIKQSEPALVAAYPKYTKLGDKQEAHIFRSKTACAAFLANNDPNYPVNVTFQNLPYLLPPWSVSILPTCRTVAFNTAKVTAPSSRVNFNPVRAEPISWQSHTEIAASALDHDAVTMKGLQDQISLTRDASDYLWYMTTVEMKDEDLKNGKSMVLSVMSACHVLHIFVNGHYSGTAHGHINKWRNLTMNANVTLNIGVNTISLLSVAMGLPNIGFLFETWKVGVLGPVTLGGQDLTKNVWSYKIGMQGEASNLFSGKGSYSVKWTEGPSLAKNQPLIWYKATFSAPEGNDPVALDMGSMKKGQIWVNSNHIGRYWPAYLARGICQKCSYAGTFNENKCVTNCHEASQKWYHIPRSWLKPTENLVVLLEEMGGNPTEIALVTRTV